MQTGLKSVPFSPTANPMDRFVTRAAPRDRVEQELEGVSHAERAGRAGSRKGAKGSWHAWPDPEKENFAKAMAGGATYFQMKIRHGAACPPRSTCRDWVVRWRRGLPLAPAGRPALLTPPEEHKVLQCVFSLRARGAGVDAQSLICIGIKIMELWRGRNSRLPELSSDWVRSFRRRNGPGVSSLSHIHRGPQFASGVILPPSILISIAMHPVPHCMPSSALHACTNRWPWTRHWHYLSHCPRMQMLPSRHVPMHAHRFTVCHPPAISAHNASGESLAPSHPIAVTCR